ncbi:hypothetical protein L228DRAFT_250719 [Xylona heveae TC161]|uniref:Uncharacterized protein n=1 Tax=Xylona heveae (strain CBS 132557 / TC161) TaxID=1328760 RepID=A0A164ZXE5_XYLHT|nr:hypothetical protein L228DRAFT_250719 [Xylona heveae TC161]KZF19657.1 hypothetical protein L228DRAFT_250719 [Xylona heveae TC161]
MVAAYYFSKSLVELSVSLDVRHMLWRSVSTISARSLSTSAKMVRFSYKDKGLIGPEQYGFDPDKKPNINVSLLRCKTQPEAPWIVVSNPASCKSTSNSWLAAWARNGIIECHSDPEITWLAAQVASANLQCSVFYRWMSRILSHMFRYCTIPCIWWTLPP